MKLGGITEPHGSANMTLWSLGFITAVPGEGVTIQLTVPVLLTAVGMLGALLLFAVKLGQAAQELRSSAAATTALSTSTAKILESMAEDVISLRIDRHLAKEKLHGHDEHLTVLETEVGSIGKDMPIVLGHLDTINKNTDGVREAVNRGTDALMDHDRQMRIRTDALAAKLDDRRKPHGR